MPESKLEETVTCANNKREYPCAIPRRGEVEISDNPAENAIHPFVAGYKDRLFSDPEGRGFQCRCLYSCGSGKGERNRSLRLPAACSATAPVFGEESIKRGD